MGKADRNNETRKLNSIKRLLLGIGTFLAVFILIIIACWFWALTPRSDREIREVASRLELPQSWKLERENIEPPSPVCPSFTTPCPQVWQTWTSSEPLTFGQIKKLIAGAGYSVRTVENAPVLEDEYCDLFCNFSAEFQAERRYEIRLSYISPNLQGFDSPQIEFYVTGK